MSTSDNSVLFSLSRLASQRFVAVVCLYGLSSTHVSRQTTNAGCMADILQHSTVMSYAFYQFRSFLLFLSFGVFLVDVNHTDMRLSCESELFLAPITQYIYALSTFYLLTYLVQRLLSPAQLGEIHSVTILSCNFSARIKVSRIKFAE